MRRIGWIRTWLSRFPSIVNSCLHPHVHVLTFYSRRYATAVYAMALCPSACLFITRQYCTKVAGYIHGIMQTTPNMPRDSGFLMLKSWWNSNKVTRKGRQIQVGAIFHQYLFISQKRWKRGHSHYGKPIGSRAWSVEWYYFHYWTIALSILKLTSECLHSYCLQ